MQTTPGMTLRQMIGTNVTLTHVAHSQEQSEKVLKPGNLVYDIRPMNETGVLQAPNEVTIQQNSQIQAAPQKQHVKQVTMVRSNDSDNVQLRAAGAEPQRTLSCQMRLQTAALQGSVLQNVQQQLGDESKSCEPHQPLHKLYSPNVAHHQMDQVILCCKFLTIIFVWLGMPRCYYFTKQEPNGKSKSR